MLTGFAPSFVPCAIAGLSDSVCAGCFHLEIDTAKVLDVAPTMVSSFDLSSSIIGRLPIGIIAFTDAVSESCALADFGPGAIVGVALIVLVPAGFCDERHLVWAHR